MGATFEGKALLTREFAADLARMLLENFAMLPLCCAFCAKWADLCLSLRGCKEQAFLIAGVIPVSCVFMLTLLLVFWLEAKSQKSDVFLAILFFCVIVSTSVVIA